MSTTDTKGRTPFWMWPFILVWKMVTAVSKRVGIMGTFAIGVILMLVGFALISSLIGALIGIPIFALGLFFLARGFY